MTTQAQDTTVRTEIVVDAPADRAFRLFTEQFDRIKPREHNMLAVDIAESVFEPRVGGRVYDRGVDGTECQWGRVLAYEPPKRIVFSWDINPMWQIESDLDKTSEVEIRFIAEGTTRTTSSSSTATLTATATAGTACAKACAATRAGRCTSTAMQPWSAGELIASPRSSLHELPESDARHGRAVGRRAHS